MRTTITTAALAVALFAAPAVAQTTTTVGSTSQLGSVLIFPHVTVATGTDTFIEISNHSATSVNIECSYINEKKGRVDFSFLISGNGTVSWDVGTRAGDGLAVPVFPTGGNFGPPGFQATSANLGELVCFAVDPTYNYQLEFNHLYGTATVLDLAVTGTGAQPKQAFKYNAWAFQGYDGSGSTTDDNYVIGTGGYITLTGTGTNTYDACPAQNVSNFMPTGATLGNLDAVNNTIWGVGCDQDLRQDFVPVLTKLEFIVWNVMEDNFTGSYICVDSVFHTLLGTGAGGNFANPGNFNFSTLKTQDAQYQVVGGVSSVCPAQTTNVGLLTIEDTHVSIGGGTANAQDIGNNAYGVGSITGYIYWDPQGGSNQE